MCGVYLKESERQHTIFDRIEISFKIQSGASSSPQNLNFYTNNEHITPQEVENVHRRRNTVNNIPLLWSCCVNGRRTINPKVLNRSDES